MDNKRIATQALMTVLLTTVCLAQTDDGLTVNTVTAESTQATNRFDITTVSGVTYANCRISRVEPNGVTLTYAKGVAKIPFSDLPEEFRAKYKYSPTNAAAYTRSMEQRQVATWAPEYDLDPSKEVPQEIKAYVAVSARERLRCIQVARTSVKDLGKTVESAANAPLKPRAPGTMVSNGRVISYRTKEEKAKDVAYWKRLLAQAVNRLRALESNNPPFFSPMPEKQPSIGMIGRLSELRVQQMVSPTEAIVERKWYTSGTSINTINGSYEAGSVYQTSRLTAHTCWLWLSGIDIGGKVDGNVISPPEILQVTETKTYPTAFGGTKTLFVVEPVDLAQYMTKK